MLNMKYLILLLIFITTYNKVSVKYPAIKDITFTMTTCNRLDLTLKTLSSLKRFGYNVNSFILMIDCFNETFSNTLHLQYPYIHFITPRSTNFKKRNARHMDNLQQLFEMVDTPWWFHCEDDWEFTAPGFIENSKRVLSDPNTDNAIYMMMGREPNSFKPHVDEKFGWRTSTNNHKYSVLRINSGASGSFTSFTANPSVMVVSRVHEMIGNFSNYKGEFDISRTLGKRYGARVGIFREHYYNHMGAGRSTMGSARERKRPRHPIAIGSYRNKQNPNTKP